MRVLVPSTVPLACMPCVPPGWWEAVPGGVAFHRGEGGLVSGAVPPLAARPWGRAARVPRPVFPGRGWGGCGDPAPAPQRALLRAVVGRCGGGGRASRGGVPCGVLRGASVQALSLSRLPVLWAGCWSPLPTCCRRGCAGVGAQHCPFGLHALRGAACRGGGGRLPRGGMAFHRCEGRLVSGAVPPPAARPLGRAARVPRPVFAGRGWCGHGKPSTSSTPL